MFWVAPALFLDLNLDLSLSLNDEEFERGERITAMTEPVNLNIDADFNMRFVQAAKL